MKTGNGINGTLTTLPVNPNQMNFKTQTSLGQFCGAISPDQTLEILYKALRGRHLNDIGVGRRPLAL